MMQWTILLSLAVFSARANLAQDPVKACDSEIYCTGHFLEKIQMAHIFNDSKTFVDMSIRKGHTPESVLHAFDELISPTPDDLTNFLQKYFTEGNEFEHWNPQDWIADPAFLEGIEDRKLYKWASNLILYWKELGRKIKREVFTHPERFSIIYVENGIIVPGGRFREFYYWDSYWIQIGLLHSQMNVTVRGMIDNFLEIVKNEEYGFVPNGGRIYYRRSQPPLLTPMVRNYVETLRKSDGDVVEYLSEVLPTLEKEFKFWMENRFVEVTDQNNNVHRLAIFNSTKHEPRPESFREDYELTHGFPEPEKRQLYTDLHSGAESGWDFSSRWWSVPEGETGSLAHTRTTNVVPTDLNAFIFLNAALLAQFFEEVGDTVKAQEYKRHASKLQDAIMTVLWDEDQGTWLDYDLEKKQRRKGFYISNFVPLWAGVDDTKIDRLVNYLQQSGALKYPGGIPTSLRQTGEQWDFPNGWAPLEHLLVDSFARSNSKAAQILAFEIAEKWTLGNYKYYEKKGVMMEKYDVSNPGAPGGGGEYEVVVGFGWSNGVILDFLARYGKDFRLPGQRGGTSRLSMSMPLMFLSGVVFSIYIKF